jgi:hypothetical protein
VGTYLHGNFLEVVNVYRIPPFPEIKEALHDRNSLFTDESVAALYNRFDECVERRGCSSYLGKAWPSNLAMDSPILTLCGDHVPAIYF